MPCEAKCCSRGIWRSQATDRATGLTGLTATVSQHRQRGQHSIATSPERQARAQTFWGAGAQTKKMGTHRQND